ncbi:Appr-1-p processing domain protein [Denitrovibrio acetiphilus DSM 12809]|uniref:Appr-1-p processing domain protein n=1 Tax=Denitrovibrio acetiphilus (strain DSM 12809 / NBRC 114555 / N2460) TaxID=522772 RepID=D4H7X7_DENA2|nr:macro domain-containing protein [Denitrovibrio acetiphilus]ADD68126.1 Appr-1-p processing domain protein [Denitrovibrio acetiphilus DSM 12809]
MGVTREINGTVLEIALRDITKQTTDAIVNPANRQLKMTGGVAGAIAAKGGRSIQEECDEIGSCPLGEAVMTGAGFLKTTYIIHAVGPRYGVDPEPEKYLKSAVMKSIELADKNNLSDIAIPAISAGIFGYPLEDAAEVIISAVIEKILSGTKLNKILLCLFTENDYMVFINTLDRLK